jgi:hypothetical protein
LPSLTTEIRSFKREPEIQTGDWEGRRAAVSETGDEEVRRQVFIKQETKR